MARATELDSQDLDDLRTIAKSNKKVRETSKFTCGQCTFFKEAATFNKKCSAMGVLAEANICDSYFPSFKGFSHNELMGILKILKHLRGLSARQIEIVMMLAQQPSDETLKFRLGDQIYARISDGKKEYWAPATVVLSNRRGAIRAMTDDGIQVYSNVRSGSFSHELPEISGVEIEESEEQPINFASKKPVRKKIPAKKGTKGSKGIRII